MTNATDAQGNPIGRATMHTDVGGVPTPVATGNPLPTAPAAGENHLGAVAGDPPPAISVTPTISTSAYSANFCVGGKLTLPNAVRVAGGSSILQSIFLIDRANQKAALSILFFNADPSASTLADHAQPTLAAADISALIRRVEIAASDWVTTDHAGTDFATADIGALAKMVRPAGGTSLYAIIVTTGTPTYTALALTLNVGVLPVS
jgi:hypothetical protein